MALKPKASLEGAPEGALAAESGDVLWEEGATVNYAVRILSGCLLHFLRGEKDEIIPLALLKASTVHSVPNYAMPWVGSDCPMNGQEVHANAGLMAVTPSVFECVHDTTAEGALGITARVGMTTMLRRSNLAVEARLAAVLLDLRNEQQEVVCNHQMLAHVTGARRETLSTILSRWCDVDILQTRYGRIKLKDIDALGKIALGKRS